MKLIKRLGIILAVLVAIVFVKGLVEEMNSDINTFDEIDDEPCGI